MTCLQRQIWAKCRCLDAKAGIPFYNPSTICGYMKYPGLIAFPERFNRSHCFTSDNMTSLPECKEIFDKIFNDLLCVRQVKRNFQLHSNKIRCNCPDPCDSFKFEISYSLAGWPAEGPQLDEAYTKIVKEKAIPRLEKYSEREDINTGQYKVILENVKRYLSDSTKKKEIMSNFLRLTVYIEDLAVETTNDVVEYSEVDLLSDIGSYYIQV